MISSTRELLLGFRSDSRRSVSEQFLNGIDCLVDAIEIFHGNRLENVKRISSDAAFAEEQNRFYSRICFQLLVNIHQNYLPLLYAGRENNEFFLLPSIDRAIAWFQSDVELSLLPSFRFNYTYNGDLENFVERTVDKLEKYLDVGMKGVGKAAINIPVSRWITFIHFPIAHRDSALDLVVISHEVAHLIDQTRALYKKFFPITLDKPSFTKEIEENCKLPLPAATAPPGTPDPQLTFESVWGRAAIEANFTRQCVATVGSWVRELVADALAIHMIGPAYLFAFGQLMALGDNEPSDSHPAPAYRAELLVEELRKMGYLSGSGSLDSILSEVERKTKSELPSVRYKSAHLVAQQTIESIAPKIQSEVRGFVSNHSYTTDRYDSEVPQVLRLLERGIAPIEIRDKAGSNTSPAGVTALIHASWELYKTRIAVFYDLFRSTMPDSKKLTTLNHLIFKAIEASEVARRWRKA